MSLLRGAGNLVIGILALQGSVIEHKNILNSLGTKVIEVKYHKDLEIIDGLIIPGGESTTINKLLKDFLLLEPLREAIQNGLPVWGTCAGLIVLAKEIENKENESIGVMDINVKRNAYGGQINSFIKEAEVIPHMSDTPIPLVFIRAPYIINVGNNVDVLKVLDNNIIAARQEHMLVTSFHPELTNNTKVHEYFINMVREHMN